MPASNDRLKIELLIDANHPDLLQGLEDWLRLGLISDRQIKLLAKKQLCSALPLQAQPVAKLIPTTSQSVATVRQIRPVKPPKPQRQSWLEQLLQAFMAEVAVVWLLFLGVFLVVASSAAIAAIQWRNVSSVGQYSILLGYTLAFGAAGLWAASKANLKVTGRMLQIASLLIIPVNFWMMDGFRLWAFPSGWVVMAIGTVALSLMQWRLLRSSQTIDRANSLLLNVLQWGWQITFVPLSFTYIAIVITTFVQAIAQRSRNTEEGEAVWRSLPTIAISFAALLLIARAIFVAGVPLSRFGLAIGLIGWLFYWRDRRATAPFWLQLGGALLGLGWLVCYLPDGGWANTGIDPLWQPLAVSGLALWALGDRLRRHWQKSVLLGFWTIGLQTYTLFRVLLPSNLRYSIMTRIAEAAQLQSGAWELTGLGFFGYIVITLIFAKYLKRQPPLARLTQQLALALGALLAIPSLFNPLVRAIYFSLSALLVFGYWWKAQSTAVETTPSQSIEITPEQSTNKTRSNWAKPHWGNIQNLIYLSHGSGLIAIAAWISWLVPTLQPTQWAWVLIAGALAEWMFAALSRDRFWQNSGWLLGMAQATCAYPLLFHELDMDGQGAYLGLPWLLIPIALTGLSYRPRLHYRKVSNVLSTIAALMALVITLTSLNPFLIALAIVTAILIANTFNQPNILVAGLATGTGLLYAGLQTWTLLNKPEPRWYLLGVAIALWGLWLLHDVLRRLPHHAGPHTEPHSEPPSVTALFLTSTNGWAKWLAIAIGTLLSLFIVVDFIDGGVNLPWAELTLAAAVALSAIIYRVSQQPTNLGLWGLAIGAELLVNLTALWLDAPLTYRVLATLILGFGTYGIGTWWRKPRTTSMTWSSFHGVPLFYGTIAGLISHTEFTRFTGLFSLVGALLFVLIGRRAKPLVPVSILGLMGISIGAYEVLIHWLMQAPAGMVGDGIILLALLAAVIALVYQVGGRFFSRWLRIPAISLTLMMFGHWILGSGIGLITRLLNLSVGGEWLWIGTFVALALTATLQGRQTSMLSYPAYVQWVFAGLYALNQIVPDTWLLTWGTAIAAAVAYLGYQFPWQRGGWSAKPWQRCSIALPLLVTCVTNDTVAIPALLLAASCYGLLAWQSQRIRLSYWGVGLALLGIYRWLNELQVTDPIWYVGSLSAALIYGIEVEPTLQLTSAKQTRHLLRCGAIGIFCLTLFYHDHLLWLRSLITLAIGMGFVGLGIMRRVRADLYIGTLTVIAAVLRSLWLFIHDESLLLWAIGIILGLLLIWIAATFESRRSQTIAFVQYWVTELERWE
ncbi:hypothetical protein IQ266_25470 [filamentous cyanobacterium LEGE 11480]|uniref:DUF2157 domain-containing protein n=1 Tax=Romeriopsis navalis LEGE 11480 TaxID=2777977 RepID=A0A928Z4Y0_9CYAN|nr:hypothetical protein [Romeriopsis navalis]MBE9033091.1 hypothetical protein [Romeriopsis navalis LEGE 11480]